MSGRELSGNEHGLVITLFLVGIIVIMACCSGCAMTPRGHMYMGQATDLVTTYYALEVDGGFVEGNDLLGDIEGVIVGKVAIIALFETVAYMSPSSADDIYKIGAFFGYAPAVWNTYQILSE